jgi:hypothetical protein
VGHSLGALYTTGTLLEDAYGRRATACGCSHTTARTLYPAELSTRNFEPTPRPTLAGCRQPSLCAGFHPSHPSHPVSSHPIPSHPSIVHTEGAAWVWVQAPDGYQEPSLHTLLMQLERALGQWAPTISEWLLDDVEVRSLHASSGSVRLVTPPPRPHREHRETPNPVHARGDEVRERERQQGCARQLSRYHLTPPPPTQMMAGPDDMIQFFEAMREMVASDDLPPNGALGSDGSFWEAVALEPTSPLGLFVRHCVAAYYALTFDSLCRLYTEVRRYVDPLGELEAPGASHPRPPLLPRGHEP